MTTKAVSQTSPLPQKSSGLESGNPSGGCPPVLADLLVQCGLDPDRISGDWLDVISMVGDMDNTRMKKPQNVDSVVLAT